MKPENITQQRLFRRIERRDKRIAGLERKIKQLESALSYRTMDLESLSRNIQKEVQQALCNVRMIPVHGFNDNKFIEVKTIPEESKLRKQVKQLVEHRNSVRAEQIIDSWTKELKKVDS